MTKARSSKAKANQSVPLSRLQLRVFDGSRALFSDKTDFLVTITNGDKKQLISSYFKKNTILFDLPFYDGLGDHYTVVVWADGYRQAGFFPVLLSDKYQKTLDVMLVPDDPGFSFADAKWPAIWQTYPLLGGDVGAAGAKDRFVNLVENGQPNLACILNILEAAGQISLPQGTPLDYVRQLRWDGDLAPAPDRFFCWCDAMLIDQVLAAEAAGKFAREPDPGGFHPGATRSWKQIEFGEANVQLTFHEKDNTTIGGKPCVLLELDIDYFRDWGAHALLEVVENKLTHSLTNPVDVYVLRWTAGQTAGIREFAPKYRVVS